MNIEKFYYDEQTEMYEQIKKEQDEVKEALGSEYTDYNLIMAKTMKV